MLRPSEIDKNICVAIPAKKKARARKIFRKTDIRISSLLRKRSPKKIGTAAADDFYNDKHICVAIPGGKKARARKIFRKTDIEFVNENGIP